MTRTFYHVDRGAQFERGETVGLDRPDEIAGRRAAAVEAYYPGGLSHHGRHYCAQDLLDDDADDLWDFACEAIFELARAARFPHRPSRFQSVFGFETRAAVDTFVDTHVEEPYVVWAVTADDAFVADMGLVDATDYADGLRRAECYWRGETNRDDPLWEALLVPPVEVVEVAETGGGEDPA